MGKGNLKNKQQRRSYFGRRILSLVLYIIVMSFPSINQYFLNSQFNRNEVLFFMAFFGLLLVLWVIHLDKQKLALGITEVVFPRRKIIIERTDDVNENIRLYKIAEREEVARVIEERKKHSYFQRLWRRLDV